MNLLGIKILFPSNPSKDGMSPELGWCAAPEDYYREMPGPPTARRRGTR